VKNALRTLWQSRAPRERLVIAVLCVVLGAVLYVWLVQSAYRARVQLGASVSQLHADAIRLDRGADEILRLRALAPAQERSPAAQPDFRASMQAKVEAAGLAQSLLSIEPLDAGQARIVFGAVPFADWLMWVEALQIQQIRLDTARIEALAAPGMASVTATFSRSRP
jgi:general secretion pathway protein M